jgi:type I restriction enzyme S subunit
MESDFRRVAIGESTIHVSDGNYSSKYPKAHEFLDAGIPFVSANNLRDGRIVKDNLKFISAAQHASLKKGHLQVGDVLLVTRGSLGLTALVTKSFDDANINAQLVLLRADNKNVDANFLFFVANSPDFQSQVIGNASGTAQPQLPIGPLKRISIPLPPFPIQRRIAGILSAYDELIENSQRRIKILEAMARALYREWFVHFRFPDHESAPRIPSPLGEIPQGWEVKKLKDVCRLTMGQSPKSEFYNEVGDGVAFHQGVTDFGDRFPSDRLFCTADGRMAEAGDILFSVRAPVGRMNIANKKIILGRGLSAIRHNHDHQAFLWEQLRNRFTKDDMMGNGSIFASATKDDMEGIELVCPPLSVVNAATQHFEPLHEEIATLSQQIQNLRRTRDLLLPRLLSGQIDVEESKA